jgi:hypothetical protein
MLAERVAWHAANPVDLCGSLSQPVTCDACRRLQSDYIRVDHAPDGAAAVCPNGPALWDEGPYVVLNETPIWTDGEDRDYCDECVADPDTPVPTEGFTSMPVHQRIGRHQLTRKLEMVEALLAGCARRAGGPAEPRRPAEPLLSDGDAPLWRRMVEAAHDFSAEGFPDDVLAATKDLLRAAAPIERFNLVRFSTPEVVSPTMIKTTLGYERDDDEEDRMIVAHIHPDGTVESPFI